MHDRPTRRAAWGFVHWCIPNALLTASFRARPDPHHIEPTPPLDHRTPAEIEASRHADAARPNAIPGSGTLCPPLSPDGEYDPFRGRLRSTVF
jgi:hypothetical protein